MNCTILNCRNLVLICLWNMNKMAATFIPVISSGPLHFAIRFVTKMWYHEKTIVHRMLTETMWLYTLNFATVICKWAQKQTRRFQISFIWEFWYYCIFEKKPKLLTENESFSNLIYVPKLKCCLLLVWVTVYDVYVVAQASYHLISY